jgi:hypothetical protein
MYSPASPGALSPDVPSPFARVEGVGDRRDNVGRITFYVMAMVKGTVPFKNTGGRGAGAGASPCASPSSRGASIRLRIIGGPQ